MTLLCGVVSFHQQPTRQPLLKVKDTAQIAMRRRIILSSAITLLQMLAGA